MKLTKAQIRYLTEITDEFIGTRPHTRFHVSMFRKLMDLGLIEITRHSMGLPAHSFYRRTDAGRSALSALGGET